MVYSVNLAVIGFSIICLNKGFNGENLLLQSKTFLQGAKYIGYAKEQQVTMQNKELN